MIPTTKYSTVLYKSLSQLLVPAQIIEAPSNTAGIIGGSVTFTCTATGNSLPSIIWSSDSNNSLADSFDLVVDNYTMQSNLTLSNLQADDFENYTCIAVNEYGRDDATAILGSKLCINYVGK